MSTQGKSRTNLDSQEHWRDWQPRPSDVQWVQRLLGAVLPGGTWGNDNGTFRLDHANKTMTLVNGFQGRIYWRTAIILKKLGWEMKSDV